MSQKSENSLGRLTNGCSYSGMNTFPCHLTHKNLVCSDAARTGQSWQVLTVCCFCPVRATIGVNDAGNLEGYAIFHDFYNLLHVFLAVRTKR